MAVLAITSFLAGVALANRVSILQVQPIAGNRVIVENPGLVIHNVTWNIDAAKSVVTGLTLWVSAETNRSRGFTIYVQVSCLSIGPDGREIPVSEYICAIGQVAIANTGPTPVRVVIPIRPEVNPEITEIHDLSFIVTGMPQPPPTPSRLPNLYFPNCPRDNTSDPACLGAAGNITFQVGNNGAAAAGPFAVDMDFITSSGVVTSSQAVGGLGVSAVATLSFPIPNGCFIPDCFFTMTIDRTNGVAESNEEDNVHHDLILG